MYGLQKIRFCAHQPYLPTQNSLNTFTKTLEQHDTLDISVVNSHGCYGGVTRGVCVVPVLELAC